MAIFCRNANGYLLFFSNESKAQRINVIAGTGAAGYAGDGGAALSANLYAPVSIVPDRLGNEYISDKSNYRIRKVSISGIISTIAGTGTAGFSGDGGPATAAKLNTTAGLAVDTFGNVYIADQGNNRIRKISTSGIITTIAGNGSTGFSGDGGPATAASINLPEDVVVDPAGNIYIADYGNSRIRKVNTAGVISTVAGISSFGSSGDGGPATAAQVVPYRLALDAAGNIYEAEFWAHRIRMINTSGIINLIVGTGTAGFSGDGGPATAATIDGPYGIAVDKYGNIFINDQNNRRIRKVNTYGNISTFAGTGTFGYSGDGGLATAAKLGDIRYVSVNDTGDVFMSDITFHRCRVIRNTNHYPFFANGARHSISLCQNSSSSLNTALSFGDLDTAQTEVLSLLTTPAHGSVFGFSYTATSTGATITPSGMSYLPTTGYVGTDSFKARIMDGMLSDTITIVFTVKPYADAGVISGASAVCMGSSTTLSESVSGGSWHTVTGYASVSATGVVTGLMNGLDTVRYVYTNGCGFDSTSHRMVIDALLDLGNISGPDSVCPWHTVILTHMYPGGSWLSSDTTKAIHLGSGVILGLNPGIITIMYIVTTSCESDTIRFRNFKISSDPACNTSVSSIAAKPAPSLNITPNPTSGTVNISIASPDNTIISLSFNDIIGRQVYSTSINPNKENTIALDLPPGLYFVSANTAAGILTQKLVIVK